MSKTCTLCREREVPCDGAHPICGSCVEFGATVSCDFSSRAASTSTKSAHLLQKGAACLPCRRKKKKCDAKRPYCSTCKLSNKQGQCVYENEAQRNLIQSLVTRTRQLEEKLASAERASPESSSSKESSSSPPPNNAATQQLTVRQQGLFPVWRPPVPELTVSRNLAPRATLEHFRIFRAQFLEFSTTVGMKLSRDATAAVLAGDFASPHVHPAVIHVAQLLGCMMWQEFNHTHSLSAVEGFELQLALSMLKEDTKPLVVLQVFNALSVYYFVRRRLPEAFDKLRYVSDLVRRHNIRFVTPATDIWDPLTAPSTESEELICALSYHMYKSIVGDLSVGVPSNLGMEYEQEFESIPMIYPTLSRSHLAVIRARCASVLRRTQRLVALYTPDTITPWNSPQPEASGQSAWADEYWALLQEAEDNLASAQPAILRASLCTDQPMFVKSFKVGALIALAAEAELYHIAPAAHAESRQLCLATVMRVVGLAKTLRASDFEMVDPFLGVCWLIVSRIAFKESKLPMDDLTATSWATARKVLLACIPLLKTALPYMGAHFDRILAEAPIGDPSSA